MHPETDLEQAHKILNEWEECDQINYNEFLAFAKDNPELSFFVVVKPVKDYAPPPAGKQWKSPLASAPAMPENPAGEVWSEIIDG